MPFKKRVGTPWLLRQEPAMAQPFKNRDRGELITRKKGLGPLKSGRGLIDLTGSQGAEAKVDGQEGVSRFALIGTLQEIESLVMTPIL